MELDRELEGSGGKWSREKKSLPPFEITWI
jgi:hypothetical protein